MQNCAQMKESKCAKDILRSANEKCHLEMGQGQYNTIINSEGPPKTIFEKMNPYPASILSWNCRLLFTSAAYIQVHLRLYFLIEIRTMSPDPKGSVWSESILFAI